MKNPLKLLVLLIVLLVSVQVTGQTIWKGRIHSQKGLYSCYIIEFSKNGTPTLRQWDPWEYSGKYDIMVHPDQPVEVLFVTPDSLNITVVKFYATSKRRVKMDIVLGGNRLVLDEAVLEKLTYRN